MTATYDGKLILHEKSIAPCCQHMSNAICLEAIKIGTINKNKIIKISIDNRWIQLRFCPFCGAEVSI